MIDWKTEEPQGRIILAKLTEDFCGVSNAYAVLYYIPLPYPHYAEDGEEVPDSAIERWATIEN